MGQANISLEARLRELEAALAKAKKLPRSTKTLTSEPMKDLLGVSWVTLRKWCDEIPGFEASGAFERGARGMEWSFKPVATLRFLIRHFEAERAARIKATRQVRRAIGGSDLDSAPPEMDLGQIKQALSVRAELIRQKREEGTLVDRVKVEAAIAAMVSDMQQAGVQAGREQDPTGQWPVEYQEAWQDAMDGLMVRMARAGEECLRQLRGGKA